MNMGNVVDSKVVELQFNNQNFESNAAKSLSTLERLKAALNFSKDTKGFDDVAKNVNKIDVKSLTSGIESLRFSLGNVAKIGAFRVLSGEIENAWNAAKGLAGELSQLNGYRGIMAGFDKYSEKTSAVQTIMAATAKDFSDAKVQMEYVNEQLDKLNWFTDETSYSFLDMVNNIGKFTSNNIPLADSVTAMEGISTWAAKSGANVQEASRAMYNLSQALATGAVKLIDWKSIENANMATAEFKQTVMDTAVELKQLTKVQDDLYKTTDGTEVSIQSFNSTLSKGWFTSDVLMKSLAKYGEFTDKLHNIMELVDVDTTSQMIEYVEQFKAGTIDIDEAAKDAGVSVSEMTKYLSELGDESLEFGLKAFKAAQEAKTFQEAIDATKDAVSTGWMKTWEIIFGDYNQARELWTGVAEGLWDVFASGAEGRNKYLKEVFQTEQMLSSSQWGDLEQSGIASPEFLKALRQVAKEHGYSLHSMVTDAGWLTQALNGERISMELVDEALERLGKKVPSVNKEMKEQAESLNESDETFKELFDTLTKYTSEDISKIVFGNGKLEEGYEELERTVDKLLNKMGLTQDKAGEFVDVLKSMGLFGGRIEEVAEEYKGLDEAQKEVLENIRIQNMKGTELFGGGLVNAIGAVAGVVYSFRDAWAETFNGLDADGLHDILEGFYKATQRVKDFTENSETLKTVFKAIAAAANIAFKALSSGLTIIGKGVSIILGPLGKLLDYLGKAVIAASDWINESDLLGKATQFFSEKFDEAAKAVNEWLSAFGKIPIISRNVNRFKVAFGKTFDNLPGLIDTARAGFTQFTTSIKETSKLKKLSFGDIYETFKANVIDPLANSAVFAPIAAAFRLLKSDIKIQLESIGIDVDGISSRFETFKENTKGAFDFIVDGITSFATSVPDMITKFRSLPIVSNALLSVSNGIGKLKSKSFPFFTEAKTKFVFFFNWLKKLDGGVTLENTGKAFTKFGKIIKSLWDSSNNPFKDIIDGAKNLGVEISKKFVNFKGFDGLIKSFNSLGETVFGFLTGKNSLSDVGDVLVDISSSIVETFTGTDFSGAIEEAFNNIKEKIKTFLTDHGVNVDGVIEGLEKVKTSITSIFDDIEIPQSIVDFFDLITGVITAKGAEIDGAAVATEESGNALSDAIAGVMEGIEEAAEASGPIGKVLDNIIKPVLSILSILLTIKGIKAISKAAIGSIKGFGEVIKTLSGVLKAQKKDLEASAKLKKAKAAAVGVAAFVGAILGILLAVKIVNSMATIDLMFGLGIVAAIIAYLALVATAMSLLDGKSTLAAGAGVFLLVLSIFGIMGLLKALEHYELDIDALIARIKSIAAVFVALGILLGMTRLIGPNAAGAAVTILAMAGAVAALALVAYLLGQVDPTKLEQGVQAVKMLSLMIALMMAVASYAKGAGGAFVGLAVAVAVLGAVIYALSGLDPETLRNVGESLAMVMAALAVLMLFTGIAKLALSGVLSVIAVFAVVSIVIGLLSAFVDADKYTAIAHSLAEVFVALGFAMLAIGVASALATVGIGGFAAILTFVAIAMAVILALGLLSELEGFDDIVERGCNLLVKIGHAIGEAIAAILEEHLEVIIAQLPNVGDSIAELFEKMQPLNDLEPLNDSNINQAIGTFLKISLAGLGAAIIENVSECMTTKSAIGTISGGMTELTTSLPDFCNALNSIGELNIDAEGITKAVGLVRQASLRGFGGAIRARMAEIVKAKAPMEQFKSDTQDLAISLRVWQALMSNISTITVPDITELVNAIEKVPGQGLVDILVNMFVGKPSLDEFGENTTKLATALVDWQSQMETIADITVPDVSELVAQLKKIPEEGGLVRTVVGLFAGKQNFDSFKEKTNDLATALSDWETKMKDVAAITVPDFTSLIQALEQVPKEGGLYNAIKGLWEGEQDFEGFGDNLKTLGDGVKGFVDALGENLDTSTLTTASEAVTLLASMGTELKGQDFGGWFHEGDMTLFGGELVTLGEKLAEFANYEIDTDKLASLADSAQTLGTFGKFVGDISISEDNVTGLETAVQKLQTATQDLNAIDLSSSDIMNTGKVDNFKSNINTMIEAIKQASKVKTGSVDDFIDTVEQMNNTSINAKEMAKNAVSADDVDASDAGAALGKSLISGINESAGAVTDAARAVAEGAVAAAGEAASGFSDAGTGYMTAMMLGITQASSIVSTAVGIAASSAYQAARNYYGEFSSAGGYLMDGLAAGINAGRSTVVNAIVAAVQRGIEAGRATAGIASPSKVMYEVGKFFVQGFVNGIHDNTRYAVAVSRDMVSETLTSFKGATDAIRDIITGDMDGDPVIRPVLDLSNVETGAARLGNMFDSSMPIGVSANVRAINGSVSGRNSVTNRDILDALDRLNASLSGVKGGDTYNVNGITYDDGSNISMAVRDLIRTVRVGRRM